MGHQKAHYFIDFQHIYIMKVNDMLRNILYILCIIKEKRVRKRRQCWVLFSFKEFYKSAFEVKGNCINKIISFGTVSFFLDYSQTEIVLRCIFFLKLILFIHFHINIENSFVERKS